MRVQAEEMAKAVRVAIDMNRGDDPLIVEGDTDTLTLDEIIKTKLADAVRLVEMEAPHIMLEGGEAFGETLSTDDKSFVIENGRGILKLPDDFMRLVSFRMSDWERTVFEAINENDPKYTLQSSRWRGICGNPEKPVVAIVRRGKGKVLEFYSCRDDTASISEAYYLPLPKIDDEDRIRVCDECYQAAVYRAASLTLASLGDQLSTTMLELSRAFLN